MPEHTTIKIRLLFFLLIHELTILTLALPRVKDYKENEIISGKNGIQAEPSCEELKAMWRFSKRQSRAAEITNEIPMYRDPFRDNIWAPYYASSKSIGGFRMNRYRDQPIFGTIVHNPPYMRKQNSVGKYKAFEEVARLYGMPVEAEPRRKITTFRVPGSGRVRSVGLPPVQGSFQHLKELIKTERARELEQQRASEEAAARAAALKELASGKQRNHAFLDTYDYLSDEPDYGQIVEERKLRPGLITFQEPSARQFEYKMVPDYGYTRSASRSKTYRPTIFDTPFAEGYSGYLP